MAQVLRTLKRRFGIFAPRVAVRAHLPWYWRWLGYIALGGLVVGVGLTTYDYGMELAGFRQSEAQRVIARMSEEIQSRETRISELRTQVAATERQLQIDRATYGDLGRQVKLLSEENAALKEDLALFQSLMTSEEKELGLSINRFRVQPDSLPGEYRYRFLLVQSGQRVREFQGTLQFVVNLEQGDRRFVVTLPLEEQKSAKEYQVSFKFFQRVEGTFKVAPGTVVKSLQVRVFEIGSITPKLSQSVSVS
jgi:multidrug efflux pump subunit AcrA (membrane-fusion protein)